MKVACLFFEIPCDLSPVAEVFLRLSPQICFGPSALFIEIGKCRRLYSEQGFRARCLVILKRLNLKARLSIARDISEAFLIAKYQTLEIESLPLKTLVDLADPFEKENLLRANIVKMIQAFNHLGISTLGQFKQIPLPELISRFGAISILCIQRLRHESQIPWPFWKPAEITLEKDKFPYFEFYGELEPILFKLKEQLDRLFLRLWGRELWIQKMQLRIFFETNSVSPNPFRHFEFDFISPQSQTKAALNIIKERLSKDFAATPVQTPIQALETKVLVAVPGQTKQKNLLSHHEEEQEQLNAILAQLIEAHGAENIFFAELTEDRRPEKSWRKIKKFQASAAPIAEELVGRIPLRPTRLLNPPQKVTVENEYLQIQHKKFKIIRRSHFNERISGDWFKKSYDRIYYHFDLEKAPSVSVFQTSDKEYYLHGYFG